MRRFLLTMMTFIIIPVTLVLTIAWITLISLNNPKLLKTTIKKENTYSKIVTILPTYIKQEDTSPIIFTADQKTRIIKAGLSEEYLTTNIESIIDDFYNWITHKKTTFDHSINLSKAKENARDEIVSIYKEKYAALGECTSSELLLLKMQSEHQFPSCRIPTENHFDSVYKNFDPTIVITDSLNAFPDKIEIPIPTAFQNLPEIINQFLFLLKIITIINVILFALCLYILFPFKKKLIRYIGLILTLTGAMLLAYKLLILELINSELTERISNGFKNSDQLKSLLLPLYNDIFSTLKNNFHTTSVTLIITGALILIIALFFKYKLNYKIIDEPKIS